MDRCFDLLDSASLSVLKEAYRSYVEASKQAGIPLPVNKTARGGGELLLRQLDCAVFQHMFQQFEADEVYPPFDTVRAAFWEGNELFPRAGFREKDHIQICVRNPNCIKGYFRELPLNKDTKYPGI